MNPDDALIINFAPTGMVPRKSETPFVPESPDEIVEQVHAAFELGITIAHLHARAEDGSPSYKIEIFEKIVSGVRKHCPGLIVCTSLSGRDFPEIEKRCEVLQLQPDMGSLTLGSLNFLSEASINNPETIQKLITSMDANGVKPELECFDSGMINYSKYLIRKGLLRPPFYYNILCGNIASAQTDLAVIAIMLRDLPDGAFWSLAGLGAEQLSANTIAITQGGGVRVGLEDNIWYDAGRKKAASNLELLKRIHRIAAEFERPIMPPEILGNQGFYNSLRTVG